MCLSFWIGKVNNDPTMTRRRSNLGRSHQSARIRTRPPFSWSGAGRGAGRLLEVPGVLRDCTASQREGKCRLRVARDGGPGRGARAILLSNASPGVEAGRTPMRAGGGINAMTAPAASSNWRDAPAIVKGAPLLEGGGSVAAPSGAPSAREVADARLFLLGGMAWWWRV